MSNRLISEILEELYAYFFVQEIQTKLNAEKARRLVF